ncbi:MBL fold metallo-hydrolase [Nonlabens xiamenensis]|uniref:MBL fold metallo-hydrolase n=1 Tax=Nonlabens xiamenensis TaxID=2341043 RepID=UPI000F609C6E|nr:MBL fold metallo-hydrolase [Nonlabens xiamenensis]
MDKDDNVDIFTRLDELRTAVFGQSVKILPDTFLLKFEKLENRFGNAYAIRHRNRKDLVLIDTVRKEHEQELVRFRESGYDIKAILLTHSDLIGQSFDTLSNIANRFETQVYIHPLDSQSTGALDITGYHDVYKEFDLSIFHTPGHTSGSIVIYCGINKALFVGDSAVGAPYDNNAYYFERPIIENPQNDLALTESWRSMSIEFEHFLPLHGKPQFDITELERMSILRNLTKTEPTKTL